MGRGRRREQGVKEYKSHKIVQAGKIIEIMAPLVPRLPGDAALLLEGGGNVQVSGDYMMKHQPEVGGYYVFYPDGYESFSPAEAFESGYTELALATATGPALAPQKPSVGRAVHYVAYGTPGGEYLAGVCRAADITEVHSDTDVALMVKNPTGVFFPQHVEYDPTGAQPGTWHWPERV